MKLPAAWTKRTGQPRWAQRVEIAMYSFGSSSSVGAALADVDGGLAGVADPVDDRDHRLAVGVGGEVVGRADALPGLLRPVEDRRHGEADDRQRDGRDRGGAERLAADREDASGGSSSRPRSSPRAWASRGPRPGCSCPPGQPSEERWSAAKSNCVGGLAQARSPEPAGRGGSAPRRPRARRPRPRRRGAQRGLGVARARPPARPRSRSRTRARARSPQRRPARRPRLPSWTWAARLIRSESSRTALEVAERGQPLEPERVEVVAGEQREVGVGAAHDRARRP